MKEGGKVAAVFRDLDRNLAVLSLFFLMLLVVAQIVARVVFMAPLVGAEELVRYFLICVVCLASAYTARTSGHIKMEELLSFLPFRTRFTFRVIAYATSTVIIGIIAYSSVFTTLHNLRNTTAALSIPFWIFFMPNNVGFILLTIQYWILLLRFIRNPDIAR